MAIRRSRRRNPGHAAARSRTADGSRCSPSASTRTIARFYVLPSPCRHARERLRPRPTRAEIVCSTGLGKMRCRAASSSSMPTRSPDHRYRPRRCRQAQGPAHRWSPRATTATSIRSSTTARALIITTNPVASDFRICEASLFAAPGRRTGVRSCPAQTRPPHPRDQPSSRDTWFGSSARTAFRASSSGRFQLTCAEHAIAFSTREALLARHGVQVRVRCPLIRASPTRP